MELNLNKIAPKLNWRSGRLAWLVVIVAILAVTRLIIACGGSSSSNSNNSLPSFPQPQVRQSAAGQLNTTLHAEIATNALVNATSGGDALIQGPTYEGTIPGPTLVVNPGDTLNISLVNDFPPNPPGTRAGAFPHAPYTTNLHTRGLEVSPEGNGDNVYRQMDPGTTNQVTITLPTYHHAGTFWYHPHDHGAVTFQLMAGMAGMLIVKGGPGTLDYVPQVQAAKDIAMVFQGMHTLPNGQVVYVNPNAAQFGSTTPQQADGLWSPYITSNTYFTTNGVIAPVLYMHPGEVQRWRMLNAGTGENLLVALQGHALNVIANDGITIPSMLTLPAGTPYVMGSGQRADVLVKAGAPGTYLLQALNPLTTLASVTPQGIAPAQRIARIDGDFPSPTYPITLASVVVTGYPVDMALPNGPLPPPAGLPSISMMTSTPPNAVRHVTFDLCGTNAGGNQAQPSQRLPVCGYYFQQYNAAYWGGLPFDSLNMIRDADDAGVPSVPLDPNEPLVGFKKGGLFDPNTPLFSDMYVGNYEQWTVTNRSFSDHVFHIHQNPFLVTAVNGIPLPVPEWHDSFIVPAATPLPTVKNPVAITDPNVTFGSITFVTHYDPITVGQLVIYCHILQHEDIGMMQRVDILPRP